MQLPDIIRGTFGVLAPAQGLTALEAQDEPREIRLGAVVVGGFFVLFLGWASLARLDAAATAQGEIAVYGHRQTVQHRDGGVVGAIYVKEGQHVNAGDVLIELAAADVKANERSLSSQVIALEAQKARLVAEQVGAAGIEWPADFATMTGPDKDDAQKAMTLQQSQFTARTAAVLAQKKVYGQRTAELDEQVQGYKSQIDAADQQQTLLGQELKGIQALADRGFAPVNKVRELQRTQAQIAGSRGQYVATIAQSQQQAGEARLQILQVDKQYKEQVASDLRDADFALNEALPKLNAAKDLLARAEIKSPATGAVMGLTTFTVGGVITPGQRLMDIVPDRAPLQIEARISPNDADDVHAGQEAEVRFAALHDRTLPIIKGQVTKVSADSFQDEKTGARYFTAEVSVPLSQVAVLERRRDANFVLKPGIPAQVLIPLHKRTALQYLMEPLSDAIWRSFRER
jgi:HlyD family secretion protein